MKEKIKQIYALLFLFGYLSFLGLSFNHHHVESVKFPHQAKTDAFSAQTKKIAEDNSDDCPICHLYFSHNANQVQSSNVIIFADYINYFVSNEAFHPYKISGSISLRGPPSAFS